MLFPQYSQRSHWLAVLAWLLQSYWPNRTTIYRMGQGSPSISSSVTQHRSTLARLCPPTWKKPLLFIILVYAELNWGTCEEAEGHRKQIRFKTKKHTLYCRTIGKMTLVAVIQTNPIPILVCLLPEWRYCWRLEAEWRSMCLMNEK